MKILYTPTALSTGYKALYNYITCNNISVNFELLDYSEEIRRLNVLMPKDMNRYLYFWNMFLIDSYKTNNFSWDNIEQDYNHVKDELPYYINFDKLKMYLKKLDVIIEDAINRKPDYMFIRYIDAYTFFHYYFAYKLKCKGITVIFGNERELAPVYFKLFSDERISDFIFIGRGENFIDKMFNDDNYLDLKYDVDFSYTQDNWRNFNFNINQFEYNVNEVYFFGDSFCPNQCTFCTHGHGKQYNFSMTKEMIDELTSFLITSHKLYPELRFTCVSSLFFIHNHDLVYFFEKLYNYRDTISIVGLPLTVKMFNDNKELISKFKNVYSYLGAEHFSNRILKLMNKHHSRADILPLLFNSQHYNIAIATIYNFFTETMSEFADYVDILDQIKNKYNFTINLMDMPYKPINSKMYNFTYIEPAIYKEYFNRELDTFHFSYTQDCDLELTNLKQKNHIIKSKFSSYMWQ